MIARVFWLSAPVALSGILHMVVVKKDLAAFLRRPIDGGRTFRGLPIFGPNKTWRGFLFMIVAAALLGLVQGLAGEWADANGIAPCDLRPHPWGYVAFNALLGLGYALGELPNSFVKRRIGIEPGKTGSKVVGAIFFVIDQADSVIAALVLGALVFPLGWTTVLAGIVALTGLHLAINASLYFLRVRKNL